MSKLSKKNAAERISRWHSLAEKIKGGSESVIEWHQKTLAGNHDEEDLEINNGIMLLTLNPNKGRLLFSRLLKCLRSLYCKECGP